MKKEIIIHAIGSFIYLACYLYVTDGIKITPGIKLANIVFLALINFAIYGHNSIERIIKNK